MTVHEAFNIALQAVEKKFEETAKKWGFTIRLLGSFMTNTLSFHLGNGRR